MAAAGVVWLTLQAGRLPWIALVLAATFGIYGLLRKVATLGALEGLTLETLLLAPIAVGMLAWWSWHGEGALVRLRMLPAYRAVRSAYSSSRAAGFADATPD